MNTQKQVVEKYSLKNGLNVLFYPIHASQKVALQMWYGVGSKNERLGQHGLAHFLEHMMFKGTEKLSELDISLVINKLSGSCNAFTSQDYTAYVFEVPSQHWYEVLPLFADCMTRATFKEELLNAELKTVIQELKMYKDDYEASLSEAMVSALFPGHPYHHPIIGYKEEVWNFKRDMLRDFYSTYYAPNNATLVVVGDIDIQDALQRITQLFEPIPAGRVIEPVQHSYMQDTAATSVTLYRDVQQTVAQYAFVIPGSSAQQEYYAEALGLMLCNGRGSRLYKKLVDDLQLATDIEACTEDMFDYSVFFITVDPKNNDALPLIEHEIEQELKNIHEYGFSPAELERARKKMMVEHLLLFDNYEQLAYEIGRTFSATGITSTITDFLSHLNDPDFPQKIHTYCRDYLRPLVMHKGFIFPLPEDERERWLTQQEREDERDEEIVARFSRTVPLEQSRYATQVIAQEPVHVVHPKALTHVLPSGLKLYICERGDVPMVEIAFDFQAKAYYDPTELQGLSLFMSKMMLEGTKKYTGQELADAFESKGMSITVLPGFISLTMLSVDFEYGCTLLWEILTQALFAPDALEKVRHQLLAELDDFWNDPSQFSGQLVRESIYQGHPYQKNLLGTKESIQKITKEDLVACYKRYITPQGTHLAIVGHLEGIDALAVIEKTLGAWQGQEVEILQFPVLVQPQAKIMTFPLQRDQITLTYAGLSLARTDKNYDKLLVFDQLFTGGSSGSMSSRLFQLREETGFFYTIGGSLLAGATDQPGMMLVATMVSLDSLHEAEKVIENAFKTATIGVTPQEFIDAKNCLLHSFMENFDTNSHMARTLLFLARYQLPDDYFDTRMTALAALSLDDVLGVARKIVRPEVLIKLRVGRI